MVYYDSECIHPRCIHCFISSIAYSLKRKARRLRVFLLGYGAVRYETYRPDFIASLWADSVSASLLLSEHLLALTAKGFINDMNMGTTIHIPRWETLHERPAEDTDHPE